MIVNCLIITIYLSFVLDLLIWPIPSEGSTKSLISFENRKALYKSFGLLIVFLLNLVFYMYPLYNALINIISGIETNQVLSKVGIAISIIGRIISLKGTLALRTCSIDNLLTKSIFKYSRNPISVGMHITILGMILIFREWYIWIGFLLYLLNMHLKIKVEERNLIRLYGADYQSYISSTPRYLIW